VFNGIWWSKVGRLGRKLVSIDCDGSSVFHGHKIGCDVIIERKSSPILGWGLFLVHKTNFIKPRPSALAKRHFAKSICLHYSQSKEVYEDSKVC
jgi:hypothetical protein